jgi:hypothetical protein
LLLVSVSLQETLWIIARGYTFLPRSLEKRCEQAQAFMSAALGRGLLRSNPLRQTIGSYLHIAGIDKGYAYFAPGVPNSYKLVFELHYPNGRTEYELPRVSGDAAGLRLVSLLDHVGRTEYDPLREIMLKMLAYSAWQEHPDVINIRAAFGYIHEPTAADASRGKTASYEFMYAYDFSFSEDQSNSEIP